MRLITAFNLPRFFILLFFRMEVDNKINKQIKPKKTELSLKIR